MTVKINNALVRRLAQEKPSKVREFRDCTLRGFILRQQPTGFISYYAITFRGSTRRGNRRQKKQRVGEHPAVAPSEARKIAEELIAKSRLDSLPIEKEIEPWPLGKFLKVHYLPWAEHHLKDPSGQRGQLRRFQLWDDLLLHEIDRLLVENWRNKRLVAGASPATINRNVVVIRAVLSKALEWGFLKHHPLAGLKNLRVDRGAAPRTISDEDRKKLFAALTQRDQELAEERRTANEWRQRRRYPLFPELSYFGDHLTPIIMTAYHTGMRRGEILSLHWDDVDFVKRRLTIRADNTKTSQSRTIPINDTLLGVLSKWKEQSEFTDSYVFPGKFGNRMDNFSNSWDALRRNLGLKQIRFKDFRSDFGSRLANNGVDLSVTQRLLGHSSPVVTMRYYVTIKEETMRSAVDSITLNPC